MNNYMNLIWGGAAIGVITSCWSHIKAIFWKVCQMFIQQVEIHDEHCAEAIISYLVKRYRRSRLYDKTYGTNYEHIKEGDSTRYGLVAYEKFGKRAIIFWNYIFPFFFNGPEKKQTTTNNTSYGYGSNSNNTQEVHAYITFVRGTLNIDKIIAEASNERNSLVWNVNEEDKGRQKRFFIKHIPDIEKDKTTTTSSSSEFWFRKCQYRLLNYQADQLGKATPEGKSSLEQLIFPERVKTLIKEIQLWRKNRDWYQKRGIPWKRGWMLYGPPGTGKTALARAFAEDLDMPIFVYDLADITNHELMRSWLAMQQQVPCIALIEDIDNVFHGRENVSFGRRGGLMSLLRRKDKKDDNGSAPKTNDHEGPDMAGGGMLNFDVFLNCLDGVDRSDGIFTIITTNDITKVDEALGRPRLLPDGTVEFISTRPGRIDKAIELGYMEITDKRLMAHRILGEYPDVLANMLDFVEKYPDLKETPAQFQERCAQLALARFWEECEAKEAAKIREDSVLLRSVA